MPHVSRHSTRDHADWRTFRYPHIAGGIGDVDGDARAEVGVDVRRGEPYSEALAFFRGAHLMGTV